MTTLTRIPKNIEIQQLPYMGEKKKRQTKHRKYAVVVELMGVMPKIGASFASLDAATRRAALLSEQYGKAAVLDQSKSVGQRMVALFKSGRNFLDS